MNNTGYSAHRVASPQPTQIELITAPLPLWAWLSTFLLAVALLTAFYYIDLNKLIVTNGQAWFSLVRNERDDAAYAAATVFSGNANRADIVILGTSATREALWLDESLEAAIANQGASALDIVNLATKGQSLLETYYLIDKTRPHRGQIFIVFLGFSGIICEPKSHKILEDDFLQSTGTWLNEKISAGLVDRNTFANGKLVRVQWRAQRRMLERQVRYRFTHWAGQTIYGNKNQTYNPFYFQGMAGGNLETLGRDFQFRSRQIEQATQDINLEYVVRLLAEAAKLIRNAGGQLVLVAAPDNQQAFIRAFPDKHRNFLAAMGTLRTKHRLNVVNFNSRVKWAQTDFIDHVHVSNSGRDKWSHAFVEWLVSMGDPAQLKPASNIPTFSPIKSTLTLLNE